MPYQAHNSGKGKHPFWVILQDWLQFPRLLLGWWKFMQQCSKYTFLLFVNYFFFTPGYTGYFSSRFSINALQSHYTAMNVLERRWNSIGKHLLEGSLYANQRCILILGISHIGNLDFRNCTCQCKITCIFQNWSLYFDNLIAYLI